MGVGVTVGAVVAVAACDAGPTAVFAAVIVFGFTTMPIYSVSTAHAHDFATAEERVELSAALMFLYAIGAIASPVISSTLIAAYGPEALFVMISLAHVLLVVFGLLRMRARPAPEYQMFWKDRGLARACFERILAWDFERVVIAHGESLEERAREVLREAWQDILNAS